MHLRTLLLAACATAAASFGCSGPSVPSPVVEDPAVSCPSDITLTAHNGSQPTVVWDTPVATKGSPPIAVACMPASASQFPSGTTTVTCEAADSRARKATCSFSVVVNTIPQLQKTRFMAFGDSLTEGKTRLIAPTILNVPIGIFNATGSYPEALNAKLTALYQDQTITMIAYGWGGELAGEGKIRLQNHWSEFNPDALLLLEGTNDITEATTQTVAGMNAAMDSVINALRTDITFAKGRGGRVFLGTLLPLVQPAAASSVAAIPPLNSRIKALAAEQSVPLVDLYAAVPATMISSVDGIHPKPGSEVYSLMADEWLKAIIATLQTRTSALPQSLLPARGIR